MPHRVVRSKLQRIEQGGKHTVVVARIKTAHDILNTRIQLPFSTMFFDNRAQLGSPRNRKDNVTDAAIRMFQRGGAYINEQALLAVNRANI